MLEARGILDNRLISAFLFETRPGIEGADYERLEARQNKDGASQNARTSERDRRQRFLSVAREHLCASESTHTYIRASITKPREKEIG